MQWEYEVVGFRVKDWGGIEYDHSQQMELLKDMGEKGWELVGVMEQQDPKLPSCWRELFFKRPVPLEVAADIGGITVEGESGETYEGVFWNTLRRAATQQIARYNKPGDGPGARA